MARQVKTSTRPNEVILVPTDFSAVTESALVHGLELARSLQCSVCLLHVYTASSVKHYNREDPACQAILHALNALRMRYEQSFAVHIEPMIREGNLFNVLNSVVSEIRPRLMVMGTHGKQGLQQIFGSHALRVVLDAPCTVLVVQGHSDEPGYHRILIPVNSEVDPVQLTGWVMQLCRLANSTIHLFQALEIIPERAKGTEVITNRIISCLKEKEIPHSLSVAASPTDFSGQVIAYACTTCSDLVMTMTMPAADATGYNFSEWNERLMFNTERIPVMFIDQADTPA